MLWFGTNQNEFNIQNYIELLDKPIVYDPLMITNVESVKTIRLKMRIRNTYTKILCFEPKHDEFDNQTIWNYKTEL